jgi:hypothetical protein
LALLSLCCTKQNGVQTTPLVIKILSTGPKSPLKNHYNFFWQKVPAQISPPGMVDGGSQAEKSCCGVKLSGSFECAGFSLFYASGENRYILSKSRHFLAVMRGILYKKITVYFVESSRGSHASG